MARWSPYDDNGGTIVAVAGENYCIIAGTTRMSTGFSILTRCPVALSSAVRPAPSVPHRRTHMVTQQACLILLLPPTARPLRRPYARWDLTHGRAALGGQISGQVPLPASSACF